MSGWLGGGGGWWNGGVSSGGGPEPLRRVQNQFKPGYSNESAPEFLRQVGLAYGGDVNTSWMDFWNRNAPNIMAQYSQAMEADPNLMLPDWMSGNVMQQYQQQYLMQDPRARGIDSRAYDKGRFDTRN